VLGYKQMLDLAEEKLKSAPVQEPVAWIWTYANGEQEVVFVPPRHVDASHVDAPSTITSLYTTPPAAQRQWVTFPTMLRKMWSGSEVQAWLDENVNKENT